MRVLFLTQSGPRGASSRYRVYQYVPYLCAQGHRCWVCPAVPGAMHDAYFFARSRLGKILLSFVVAFRRVMQLLLVPFADVVFIQKPLLPPGWPRLQRWMRMLARKVIFDCDDAIFLRPPAGEAAGGAGSPPAAVLFTAMYQRRFADAVRNADLVLAGNEYLAGQAGKASDRVEVFPTVVDTQRFCPPRARARDGAGQPLTMGWMGSPSTAPYLEEILPAMQAIAQRFPVQWIFIGASSRSSLGPSGAHAQFRSWRYETEISDLQSFDIFISPLRDTPWEQGKCGLKALTAMSVGLPVIASRVGVHRQIIQDGVNGFLACDAGEWTNKLTLLLNDAGLRRNMGEAARKTVERNYSLSSAAPRFAALLCSPPSHFRAPALKY